MSRFDKILLVSVNLFFISAVGMVICGPVVQARQHDPLDRQALPVVLSPDGLSRQMILLPSGSYSFVINRAGLDHANLVLEQMPRDHNKGHGVGQEFMVAVGTGVKRARLTTGVYRLWVEGRATWVAEIHVR